MTDTISEQISAIQLSKYEHTPFPAASKHASALVNSIHTEASSTYFSDKILITISQAGRLSQWVPMSNNL